MSIKVPALNAPEGLALLVGVGVIGFIVLTLFLKKQAAAAIDGINHFNDGTPYAGTGIVGSLGNVTNQLSGGVLADAGENLGGWLYSIFGQDYNPNASDPNLQTRKQAVTDNADDQGAFGGF